MTTATLVLAALAAIPVLAAPYWDAPNRGAKVAALIPGRQVPKLTPDTLFAEWTGQQVERWARDHPPEDPAEAYARYAVTSPTDAELVADFPVHISPFGQVRSGQCDPAKAAEVLISYCPFCGSETLAFAFDPDRLYRHAVTTCCRTDLYARTEDYPPGSALGPTTTVSFQHLDDTEREAPCTLYRDRAGVEWALFIPTLFDHHRWVEQGCDLVRRHGERFRATADPLHAHKIAVILDQVADTYYGLPLSAGNDLATGKDGRPLTRAEWEALPRPAIFEVGPLGPWNRRLPLGSKGWLNMFDEHIWVEPFARARHHPAFKEVSRQRYGDPEALDRKIMVKLLRELSLAFQSIFSQKLLHNYQEAIYVDLWLTGVLLQDKVLLDFTVPTMELSMYNHTYQDGMNGEGAPNYMAMPGGYYYPYLMDPQGWLQYDPEFLTRNPFYTAAAEEMRKTATVRGLQLEFGDQHEHAFAGQFLTDPQEVRRREAIGSRNWPGYGVGLLRVGGGGHRLELGLDYTRATLHNAQDPLSLECWVDGVPVLRKGGYGAWWSNAHLQWDRPEYQALKQMGYPCEIAEGERSFDGWSWNWNHSPQCQNTVTVDEVATGKGWGDNRGYGECVTYKGGEAGGAPGSGFQVLDVRDHYSWSRVGKQVPTFRRTLMAVEGPDGRPYAMDLLHLVGEQRHALYTTAFGERAEDRLPRAQGEATDLAEVLFGATLPEDNSHYRNFRQIRQVERLGAPPVTWDVTWKTDYAALAPRDPGGKPFVRPLPDDVGRVRLRCFGLDLSTSGSTELLRGKGPWIGWLRQPLPNGALADGNVAFMDARDFLVESRRTDDGQPLDSTFVHVLEGFREGEASAIRSVQALPVSSVSGPERRTLALEVNLAGHVDTLVYQAEAGEVRLADGTETDARYALLRRDAAGEVVAVDVCRGTYLRSGKLGVTLPGDFMGTIVDVVGDLTGTRQESALIVRPDRPWPADGLQDRQVDVRVESPLRESCNEGYRIREVAALEDDLVRIDLQDHAPFAVSWHEVTVLPEDRPNVLRTWRPMVDHGNAPWYCGLNVWFPERDRTYTIKAVNEVGGGYGGDTLELADGVDLAADGVRVGDWYVIHAIRPGLQVTVPNDFSWRREPVDEEWQQYSLRATGAVHLEAAATAGPYSYRAGSGAWADGAGAAGRFSDRETGRGAVQILVGRPAWLDLQDPEAPQIAAVALDGAALDPKADLALGTIPQPRALTVEFADAANPLDRGSVAVTLDGRGLGDGAGLVSLGDATDGRRLSVAVNLAQALAAEPADVARKHTLEVAVRDRSVDRHRTTVTLTYINAVPLDPNAIYLSDLTPVRSFAHGNLIRDTDYVGNPAGIAGRSYAKCLTLCPEPSPDGAHSEAVYDLPQDRGALVFRAEAGITESARALGSATFVVYVRRPGSGPEDWERLHETPVLRGGQDPVRLELALGDAVALRLYCTDAGDGINSDHACWGNARLTP